MNHDATIHATLSAFAPNVLATIHMQLSYGIPPPRIAKIFGAHGEIAASAARHIMATQPRRQRGTTEMSDENDDNPPSND